MENFLKLKALADELRATSSSTRKIEILKNYKENSNKSFNDIVLPMVFDKDILFHVKSDTILSYMALDKIEPPTECQLLNHFKNIMSMNGSDKALSQCKEMYEALAAYGNGASELYLCIIDKDLKCGVSSGLFKKVFPELSQEFPVALADKYFGEQEDKVNFDDELWLASRKMDGCRCLALIDDNGKCSLMSRQKKPFTTLDLLRKEIEGFGLRNTVFDGECCIVDENGDEHFDWIMKEIKRKNHTIQNPLYQVFDMLTLDEFYGLVESPVLSDRLAKLSSFFDGIDKPRYMKQVKQTVVKNKEHFNELYSEAMAKRWEGLIIRKNVPYEGKRTKNMLKCKSFNDNEYEVISHEIGPMRFVENGSQVELEVLTSVDIIHKGFRVQVGSGFSKEQRLKYKEHPELIDGAVITVQYFEETKNQDGGISLRFPTVKAVYENGRDV